MTELDKIKRAKMYMEKLANGINPIDDTVVPNEDVINQVRLSRCFSFVSDVLRQVIESGGTRFPKRPFELSPEKRSQFAYSKQPISINEIVKRINALVDSEDMQKCSYPNILSWLLTMELMEWVALPNGKRTRHPTEAGRKIGISMEERTGEKGPYQAVLYDVTAQRFIIENLDAILSAANSTQTEPQGATEN